MSLSHRSRNRNVPTLGTLRRRRGPVTPRHPTTPTTPLFRRRIVALRPPSKVRNAAPKAIVPTKHPACARSIAALNRKTRKPAIHRIPCVSSSLGVLALSLPICNLRKGRPSQTNQFFLSAHRRPPVMNHFRGDKRDILTRNRHPASNHPPHLVRGVANRGLRPSTPSLPSTQVSSLDATPRQIHLVLQLFKDRLPRAVSPRRPPLRELSLPSHKLSFRQILLAGDVLRTSSTTNSRPPTQTRLAAQLLSPRRTRQILQAPRGSTLRLRLPLSQSLLLQHLRPRSLP
jgi:hypothetical protein